MIMQIGITAGEIWHVLDERGKVTLEDMITKINRSREVVLMSLGWLAREGHVSLQPNGKSFSMELTKTKT